MQYNLSAQRARSFLVFLLVASLLTPLFFVGPLTQTASAQFPDVDQLSCRDVFGQGELSISFPVPTAARTTPGAFFAVPVAIHNAYAYPLRDLAITAAVYEAGSDVPLDWFSGDTDIDLEPDQRFSASLQWKVPNNTPAGAYEIKVFLTQGDAIDPLGAALSTNSSGDTFSFTVAGDSVAGTALDAASLMVNGESVAADTFNTIAVGDDDVSFSVVLTNEYTDRSQTVPVTMAVYNSAYPHLQNLLESETSMITVGADGETTQAIEFTSAFGEYVVTGQSQSSDGARSSFITFLENENKPAFNKPAPAASLVAMNTADGAAEVVACIKNRESVLLDAAERAPLYPVEYRVTVYPFTNRVMGDEVIMTTTESAELGGGVSEVGFSSALPAYDGEVLIKVETLVDGWPIDTTLISYDCDSERGCERPIEDTPTATGVVKDPIDKQIYLFLLMLLLIVVVSIVLFVRHTTNVAVGTRESREMRDRSEQPESEDLLEGSDDDIK